MLLRSIVGIVKQLYIIVDAPDSQYVCAWVCVTRYAGCIISFSQLSDIRMRLSSLFHALEQAVNLTSSFMVGRSHLFYSLPLQLWFLHWYQIMHSSSPTDNRTRDQKSDVLTPHHHAARKYTLKLLEIRLSLDSANLRQSV